MESSLRALRIVITTMPVMMFAMNVTTLAVVWYGGNIIIAGKMPVGDLTAIYDVYRADPDVPYDAFHGILTELPLPARP